MVSPAKIVAQNARYCIATWSGTVIQLWRSETPPDGVECVMDVVRNASPPVHSTLIVVEENSELPNPVARKLLEQLTLLLAPSCKVVAMIHEGSGFRAAAIRAILTSLVAISKQAFPYKIFKTVELGTTWMMETRPDIPSLEQLGAVVSSLRDDLRAAELTGKPAR